MNRNTLLIADDMEINRVILRALFKQNYNLLEAENGEQALLLLNQYKDNIAAVLLDAVMPIKDGYEVMAEMKKTGLISKIPVIIITSDESIENEVRAFDLGASDIILKPIEPHVVKRRVQNAVELSAHKENLEQLVEDQAEKLRKSKHVLIDTLSSVIEHRSLESGQHILRIRMFTKLLLNDIMRTCPEYDLNERIIGVIASASALHDIGKISIPDAILNKPGSLTKDEFDIMKTHSEKGCEILSGINQMDDEEYLRYAYNICMYHHERWDGRGYPKKLKGDSVPICAQAVGIADAYDALTTQRVYKNAFSASKAYSMILNGECGAFSPKLLECFKRVRAQFVELSQSYADGYSPSSDTEKLAVPALMQAEEDNMLKAGQMKYAAMLRFAGSTIIEVNLDTGAYNLVYSINEVFEVLRFGTHYEDAFRELVAKCIHPDDMALAYDAVDTYARDFIENGLLKRTRKYRIFNRESGDYNYYEVTVLRIDINNPRSNSVLVVWKELSDEALKTVLRKSKSFDALTVQNLMIGIQQCANDRWFTILDVNQGFLNLFGYSRAEIDELFHGHFSEMIFIDDRDAALKFVQEQQLMKTAFEQEYRVLAKDGRIVWVLDKCQLVSTKDGTEVFSCALIDITVVKKAQEDLRLTMERHQIIMNQTNDIIFDYDVSADTVVYSSNWFKRFGYEPITSEVSTRVIQSSRLFAEDIDKFVKLAQEVSSGVPYGETELRIANAEGRYIWCRLRATAQFDKVGNPVKAIGVILDIDTEKRHTQELIDKAERDVLTKLYNKSAARNKIQQLLDNKTNDAMLAMLIIDIDNFKLINDLRGHMYGDAVLAEIAGKLTDLFNSNDIIARIGGDEFLILTSQYSDICQITDKAAVLIKELHNIFKGEIEGHFLSCSIGISFCPTDGLMYETLFQSSDQALHYAKQFGKDRYIVFDKNTMSKAFGLNNEQLFAASTRIDSDDTQGKDTYGIVQQAFKILYEGNDLEQAVNSIIEVVGRIYNVSRVYIFEDTQDGDYVNNTFEWCNDGIEPEIDMLQNLSYEKDLNGKYRENFDENGVFYCRDIALLPKEQYNLLKKQNIHSILQYAVTDNGQFVGFVGFDDCTVRRVWTQEQIDALSFLSELLSTFLLKKRAQDRALAMTQDLKSVLDNQNSWIYVIDPKTYVLKYINAKTHGISPKARIGMHCYDMFFNRNQPCEICPARDIDKTINKTLEIYNPVLNVWSIADASYITWGGQSACLLSCHDITVYKNAKESNSSTI